MIKISEVDIIYSCKECGWTYSLQRNSSCPMCKTEAEIDQKLVVEIIQEYSRRKGIFVKKAEAKSIATNFKKKFKRLPTFKELWALTDKVVLEKTGKKKISIEEKVDKKLKEMKLKEKAKEERKEKIEARRKEVAAKVGKVEETAATSNKCGKCGHINPPDSNFCLECGTKLK
ncbi:MAG: zinc ribbon domain-containing protein [Promethearchaeota archaeon]